MRNVRRNLALIASTAVIGTVGIGGVMTAQANTNNAPQQSSNQ
ncbi:MAG: hypothetical protein JWO11_656, partial [Nocardioides sp.]|nr:hypothetical protein [Nocardioides sp.]